VLCQYLEKVRTHFGNKPIIITSGYRPPAVNNAVGGARNSEHLYDKPNTGALDFWIKDVDMMKVQDYVDKTWPYSCGFAAPQFIHLGMRPGKPKIRWDYN
jgi:uncharacterized protein YcbK (DUF882 family)